MSILLSCFIVAPLATWFWVSLCGWVFHVRPPFIAVYFIYLVVEWLVTTTTRLPDRAPPPGGPGPQV